jgi:hypothetical protein
MNFASLFNYFEAGLWFTIAFTVFMRRKNLEPKLKKLAAIVSISFALFSVSDIVEASTGAWWKPLWLLGLKGLCLVSFVGCWIKYSQLKSFDTTSHQSKGKISRH